MARRRNARLNRGYLDLAVSCGASLVILLMSTVCVLGGNAGPLSTERQPALLAGAPQDFRQPPTADVTTPGPGLRGSQYRHTAREPDRGSPAAFREGQALRKATGKHKTSHDGWPGGHEPAGNWANDAARLTGFIGAAVLATILLSFAWLANLKKQVALKTLELQHELHERMRAEQVLRESENRYRTLVENIDLGITLIDGQKRIVMVNEGHARMFRRTAKECVGQECFRMFEGRDTPCPHCPGEKAMQTGLPSAAEAEGIRDDGSRFTVHLDAVPVFDPQGVPTAFIEVVEDITDRKRAEEALRQSEEKYKGLAKACPDGVVMSDLAGTILFASSQMAELLGIVDPRELVGRSIFECAVEEDRQRLRDNLESLLKDGVRRNTEYLALRRDGTTVPVETSTAVIRDANGRPKTLMGTVRDITGRRRVDEELREATKAAQSANRAKSEFLANMSHEIRTPMTAILGFAEVLLSEEGIDKAPPDRISAIRTIQRNGENLLNLINDILDLSKVEAGKQALCCEPCSPRQLVQEVVDTTRLRADAKGLSLAVEYQAGLPEAIHTDPLRLRQILVNLLGNAVKFTEVGSVRVAVAWDAGSSAEGKLRIDVIDTGIGIAEEHLSMLFRPFSQVDTSIHRRYGGTGLGLAISKRLALMLGGEISVSSALTHGSTFRVTVTARRLEGPPDGTHHEPAARSASSAVPMPRLNGRILLAEDGPDNQRLIAYLLRKAGAQVTVVDDGQKALAQISEQREAQWPFDLVLMDMQMPVMDGYEATRKLRELGYRRPILALTAHAMTEDRQKCLDAGCDDHLAKPVDRATLLQHVSKYLVANETLPHAAAAGCPDRTPSA